MSSIGIGVSGAVDGIFMPSAAPVVSSVAVQTLILDTFEDSDGTDLEDHAPDTNLPGGSWQDYSPDADPLNANINGNRARLQDNGDGQTRDAVIDCGIDDGIRITGTFVLNGINGSWGGFTYWNDLAGGRGIARTQQESDLVIIYPSDGGGGASDTLDMSPGDTLSYELVIEGDLVTFTVENLTAGGSVTVSLTDTGTKNTGCGLSIRTAFGAGGSDYFDDFQVDNISEVAYVPPVTLFLDEFDGSDETTLADSVPSINLSGASWSARRQLGDPTDSDWISDGAGAAELTVPAVNSFAGLDLDVYDNFKIYATLNFRDGTYPGIVWRWDDVATPASASGQWQRIWLHSGTSELRHECSVPSESRGVLGDFGDLGDGVEVEIEITVVGNTVSIYATDGSTEITDEYDDSDALSDVTSCTWFGIGAYLASVPQPAGHQLFRVEEA